MNSIDLTVAVTYGGLGGAYLVVLPFLTYLYLQKRWYVASSLERGFMYFLVMFFFPGMILLAPFLNIRPQPRSLES